MHARASAEVHLHTALDVMSRGECLSALDHLPVPIYATDAEGTVTYWNPACAEFAGREPQVGTDKWCVTWQIFTTAGDRLPHEKCPMAQAIQEKRPIRGAVAIAARPDGSRRAFTPYPTPLIDDAGKLHGAVNMLVDVSEEQSSVLAEQAARCRRLADATYDRETCGVLGAMADGFERSAAQLRKQGTL